MITSSKLELYFEGSGHLVNLEDSSLDPVTIQTTTTGTTLSTTPSFVVATFEVDNLGATTSTTQLISKGAPDECVRVETRNGRSLVVGPKSRLLVSDPESGRLVQVTPEEAVGMLVPIYMGNPFTPTQFNSDLAWWYAVLVADGWLSGNAVGYSKDDDLKRERFAALAASHLTPEFSCKEYHDTGESEGKFAPSTKIHLNGAKLVKMVESIYHPDIEQSDGSLRGALFKMLPRNLLMNGSEECLWGLLSGLIDGDSSLGWNLAKENPRFFLRFNTSSPYLRDDIVLLLRKLKIRSSVTTTPARGRSQESYVVLPSIVDVREAVKHIRCVGEEENDRLSEFSATYQGRPNHDNLDVIPYPRSTGTQIQKDVGSKKDPNLYSTVVKAGKSGRITRETIINRLPANVLAGSVAAEELLRVASNSNLLWDEIVSVTPANKQPLYKVQVTNGLPLILWDGWVVPSDAPVTENQGTPK